MMYTSHTASAAARSRRCEGSLSPSPRPSSSRWSGLLDAARRQCCASSRACSRRHPAMLACTGFHPGKHASGGGYRWCRSVRHCYPTGPSSKTSASRWIWQGSAMTRRSRKSSKSPSSQPAGTHTRASSPGVCGNEQRSPAPMSPAQRYCSLTSRLTRLTSCFARGLTRTSQHSSGNFARHPLSSHIVSRRRCSWPTGCSCARVGPLASCMTFISMIQNRVESQCDTASGTSHRSLMSVVC